MIWLHADRQNRYARQIRIPQIPDPLGRSVAVQTGHLDVHDHGIVVERIASLDHLRSHDAASGRFHLRTVFPQDPVHLIQYGRLVIHDQETVSGKDPGDRILLIPQTSLSVLLLHADRVVRRQLQIQQYVEDGSLALLAGKIDLAAHHLHQLLRDREAESASGDPALLGGTLSRERFKGLAGESLIHADAVILHQKFDRHVAA